MVHHVAMPFCATKATFHFVHIEQSRHKDLLETTPTKLHLRHIQK